MSFLNKKILITGSTKGLGKELAIEFDKLGSNLVIVGRSKKIIYEMKRTFKNAKKHLFFDGDLMSETVSKNLISKINKKLKKIDIIIHCLGGSFGINSPLENWKNFQKSLKGNLGVAIDINKIFIPMMIKKKQGNIIHVGSVVSHEANASVPYVTSKASVSAYVRVMGNYLANYGITMSGILPGAFYGDQNAMSRFKYYKPEEYKKFLKLLPQSKMPLAKDYIKIIKLLSSHQSKIFSGSMIYLDQGQSKTIHQINV
jgi:3-oxoacyl-[acyl-carrier protein] reductase|tara:strand:+ start:38 stop:808 length:771 start_codon:yes stop_codon:yes gene_type:complete